MSAIEQPKPQSMQSIQQYLEARKSQLAQIVPKHLSVDRLLKVALNSIAKTPKLRECSTSSVLQCVATCAELGLEPGGALGEAYLIPYGKTDTVCTLIIGYRGFVALMRRSGQLSTIRAVVVHERDRFVYREGIETTLEHEPCLDGDPGELRFVYVVLRLADGGIQVEVMSKTQIDAIRARSKTPASMSPWSSDYEEMAKKTVIRRAAKLAPMSSELARAIEAEDEVVDGEVLRRNADALSLGAVQAPPEQRALPAPQPRLLKIEYDPSELESKLRESVEIAEKTGQMPRPTPPVALGALEQLLADIEATQKASALNQLAKLVTALDGEAKATAMAAYSARAQILRGGK